MILIRILVVIVLFIPFAIKFGFVDTYDDAIMFLLEDK